jgi:hypothetical protein
MKAIIDASDIVFGIWQDSREPGGVGRHVIKGQKLLGDIAASRQAHDLKIDAIACNDLEQAVACQKMLGQPGFS